MGLFGGGNSKSSTTYNQTEANDSSQVLGLAAVKGDRNITQILDADAIKESYAYAAKVGDNTSNNISSLLNTVENVAGKALSTANENSSKTISALQSGLSQASGSIQTAYAKAQNSGIDPQTIMLGLAALTAAVFIFRK